MLVRSHNSAGDPPGDALDAREAARLLGAHVETLRRLARRGLVPAFKLGKDWRFSRQALTRWTETNQFRGRPPLVMAVDDERDIREMLRHFLESNGYRVALAESAQRAVESARREMPELVLLDLVMPDTSGVEVLKELHTVDPDLPVVIVTGYPDSTLMAEALRYPPVTLLPKPVDRETLLRSVHRLLTGSPARTAPARSTV